jgi:hypothetical protein
MSTDSPYPERRGQTHYESCYRDRGHHNCAVAEVDRLRAELASASADRERLDWLDAHCTRVETPDSLIEAELDGAQPEGHLYFCWHTPPASLRPAIDSARSLPPREGPDV